MDKTQELKLLGEILHELKQLNKKSILPQMNMKKNLSFLLDLRNNRWASFNPINPNNMRLFGYYYHSAPLQLSKIQEGWVPLSIDLDGKLKVNAT